VPTGYDLFAAAGPVQYAASHPTERWIVGASNDCLGFQMLQIEVEGWVSTLSVFGSAFAEREDQPVDRKRLHE